MRGKKIKNKTNSNEQGSLGGLAKATDAVWDSGVEADKEVWGMLLRVWDSPLKESTWRGKWSQASLSR